MALGTVNGVTVYANDVVVNRTGDAPNTQGALRSEITMFSRKSRQRLAFVAANTSKVFRTMITLTYPAEFPTDGLEVKRHLREFLRFLRKDWGNPSYLWFLEWQKRGAPHVHILVDKPLPGDREETKWARWRIAATWFQIVDSHDARHFAAGTRTERVRNPDGAAHYAVKYACKPHQKCVPKGYRNVGRMWGHSADVRPVPLGDISCTEDDVRGTLEGWRYAPSEDDPLYHVLFGTSGLFAPHL
jgi:hypothetical protein